MEPNDSSSDRPPPDPARPPDETSDSPTPGPSDAPPGGIDSDGSTVDAHGVTGPGGPGADGPEVPPVPGYEILDRLGRGGTGVVYRARDVAMGRDVALKMLRTGPRASRAELTRFRREVQALAGLDHPNIVPIYDVGEHAGQPYFTMKFYAGGSLDHQTARFADPKPAARLVETVARAVEHLHQRVGLHRDLKPHNILLDEAGEPHVSDFGLVKPDAVETELTAPGLVLGTLPYMAPEQATGRTRQVGRATDVWALGVILYELLAGRRPFVAGPDQDLAPQILFADPPRLRKLRPGLSPDLEAIVERCLCKKPEERYPTAADLADDLRRWLDGKPIQRDWAARWRWTRRLLTRPVIWVALTVVIGVGLLALNRPVQRIDPGSELHRIESDLSNGRPTELIGETGPPRWYRQVEDRGGSVRPNEPDSPFTVESARIGMIELLPRIDCPAYELEAEMRQEPGTSMASVGFYSSYSVKSEDGRRRESFYTFLFSDRGGGDASKPPLDSHRRMDVRHQQNILVPKQPLYPMSCPAILTHPYQLESPQPEQYPWHRLRIVVRPKEPTQVWWYDKQVGTLNEKMITRQSIDFWKLAYDDLDLVAAVYNPRGGIGAYVSQGMASFRNVVIRPAP
jgi:serine/threonine protein kinase